MLGSQGGQTRERRPGRLLRSDTEEKKGTNTGNRTTSTFLRRVGTFKLDRDLSLPAPLKRGAHTNKIPLDLFAKEVEPDQGGAFRESTGKRYPGFFVNTQVRWHRETGKTF